MHPPIELLLNEEKKYNSALNRAIRDPPLLVFDSTTNKSRQISESDGLFYFL